MLSIKDFTTVDDINLKLNSSLHMFLIRNFCFCFTVTLVLPECKERTQSAREPLVTRYARTRDLT